MILPESKYPAIRGEMVRNFGIVMSDELIERVSKKDSVLRRALKHDICDTMERDLLIDQVVLLVLGEDWSWPRNGDDMYASRRFSEKFVAYAHSVPGLTLFPAYWFRKDQLPKNEDKEEITYQSACRHIDQEFAILCESARDRLKLLMQRVAEVAFNAGERAGKVAIQTPVPRPVDRLKKVVANSRAKKGKS